MPTKAPGRSTSASARFTASTVAGSAIWTETFLPSRVSMARVCPFTASIVPRIRVGGAVWASAVAAKPSAAQAISKVRAKFGIAVPSVTGFRQSH